MNHFKLNDRVAFYRLSGRKVGTVIHIDENTLGVKDDSGAVWHVHYKQCRRIKPKVRRELWVNYYPGFVFPVIYHTKEDADEHAK